MIIKELDENEKKTIDKAMRITSTDYEVKGNYIQVENLMLIIEDLIMEYDNIEYEYNEYREKVKNDYEPKSFDPYSEYGVSPRDFY